MSTAVNDENDRFFCRDRFRGWTCCYGRDSFMELLREVGAKKYNTIVWSTDPDAEERYGNPRPS